MSTLAHHTENRLALPNMSGMRGTPGTTDVGPQAARLAREALAEGRDATLLLRGEEVAEGDAPLYLQDRQGCPTFVCTRTCSLLAHAGQAALLRLAAPGNPQLTVVIGGRIRAVGRPGRAEHRLVELDVEQVVVHDSRGRARPIVVPLETYRQADPKPPCRFISQTVEHTNERHLHELRRLVARHTGRPAKDIAGASLVTIDWRGCTLMWIDEDGAHTLRLPFEAPATNAATLRRELHRQLR